MTSFLLGGLVGALVAVLAPIGWRKLKELIGS